MSSNTLHCSAPTLYTGRLGKFLNLAPSAELKFWWSLSINYKLHNLLRSLLLLLLLLVHIEIESYSTVQILLFDRLCLLVLLGLLRGRATRQRRRRLLRQDEGKNATNFNAPLTDFAARSQCEINLLGFPISTTKYFCDSQATPFSIALLRRRSPTQTLARIRRQDELLSRAKIRSRFPKSSSKHKNLTDKNIIIIAIRWKCQRRESDQDN